MRADKISRPDRPQQPSAEDQPTERDEREARLGALLVALRVHEFVADAETPLRLLVSNAATPGIQIPVRCTRRASDGDRLWFLGRDDRPLAPADDITGTLVALKDQTAVRL